jgi:hypothetical protein
VARRVKTHQRLRTILLICSIAALLSASLYARFREPPTVRIHEIETWMSFSTVHVKGILETGALEMRDGSLLYMLADETGSLPIFLNASTITQRPAAGNVVVVKGRLGLASGHRASLQVGDVDGITVQHEALPATVRGILCEVRSPAPGSRAPHRLILERSEGRMELIHWFTPDYQASAGDRVEAVGTLGFYRGRKQLKVNRSCDLRCYPDV